MTPLLTRGCLAALCLAGIYVAAHMFIKQRRIESGALRENSVVSTPRAKLAGISNGLIGLIYYAAFLLALPALQQPAVHAVVLSAAFLAAAFSLYLGYSLAFVTRRSCRFCWTGHIINWLLLALMLFMPW